ncbi:MFS transporter [Streptomyces sp. RPA4-5]|uniref:MFS transporter n=1 Tax=Streptomyces sp. RPA4-5 TaxID=2721245 RepID=UPI002001E464|nr:MFS transporter [Streptomyces sp. RPA4-5]
MTSLEATGTIAAGPDTVGAQRRILTVLVISQIFSGAGLAAGVTVGALLAQDMLGTTGLAGLPSALFAAGSALAAISVGRISQAKGRRPGLAAGYLAGAIGSAGVIAAAVLDQPVLLFLALFVYGAGTATNLQARYAGADLAAPAHRARAVSTVLVATTLGGVVGPNLAAPTGALGETLGIPYLAGPFLLAGAAYALAALVLAVWLRPDPSSSPAPRPTPTPTVRRPRPARRPTRLRRGPRAAGWSWAPWS